jgi:hypothetical protein
MSEENNRTETTTKTKRQPKRRHFASELTDLQSRVDTAVSLLRDVEGQPPEVQVIVIRLALKRLQGE